MTKFKIVKEEWLAAIAACGGMVTFVAAMLGVHRHTVRKYRDSITWIGKAFKEAEEACKDKAEKAIQSEIEGGNWKASAWYLERKGKDRGFGKELKIETDEKPGVIHMHFPDDGRSGPDPLNDIPPEQATPNDGCQPPQNQIG